MTEGSRWAFALLVVGGVGAPLAAFSGPDVVVCRIGGNQPTSGYMNYGEVGGIRAFAVATLACNQGDTNCQWDDDLPEPDNAHPVISQNMFRLRNGRFEQIGQSWLKHTFGAAEGSECGLSCTPAANGIALGVGCCDAYREFINGTQTAGPKSEVNPATGYFLFPFCNAGEGGLACPPPQPTIGRRLQVKNVDLDLDPAVIYVIETQFILPDDAMISVPPTDDNNASYRRITLNAQHNLQNWQGFTQEQQPGIKAWQDHGLGPATPDPGVLEVAIDVPDDGRFWFAGKATNLGGGIWHYEYAVQNLNSDRAGQAFFVPLPPTQVVNVTNIEFHDVDYHSGEIYALTDWSALVTSGAAANVGWTTESFELNPLANALRWGTLYNFRFDADAPPKTAAVTLTLFKPGDIASIVAALPVPAEDCNDNDVADETDLVAGTSQDVNLNGVPDECEDLTCPADIAPIRAGDGTIAVDDLLLVINSWGPCPECAADVAPSGGNGEVDVDDLLVIINGWGPCP